jgi:hypothetical protein
MAKGRSLVDLRGRLPDSNGVKTSDNQGNAMQISNMDYVNVVMAVGLD